MLRWWMGAFVFGCACGPSRADGMQSGSGSDGDATSATAASADADHDGGSPGTSESSPATTSTSSDPVDTSAGDDGSPFDVAGPTPEVCMASVDQAFDLEISGPDGDVAVMHGWWGWEACCVVDPWIVLAQPAVIQVFGGAIEGPHLPVYVRGASDHRGPYVGPLPIAFAPPRGEIAEIELGFELLEPLDPDTMMRDEQPRLSATFEIDAEGWSAHGSVLLPHCPALDTDPCPCE
jgi:hypothetical protein